VIGIAYLLSLAAGALFFVRLLRGPSLTDRTLALDGMITAGVAALVVNAYETDSAIYLPVAVVLSLVGFIGTSVVARFIEGRGR
jgi:multicomponent Na+:H+ antiporter subunit F